MRTAATGVSRTASRSPRFEGWNLVPMAGVPLVGLLFANRINTIADGWRDAGDILSHFLRTDGDKIAASAAHYRAANPSNGRR